MVRPENAVAIMARVEVPVPVCTPRLHESLEAAVLRVRVPDIVPIARHIEVVRGNIEWLAKPLGDESDGEVIIRIFEEAGGASRYRIMALVFMGRKITQAASAPGIRPRTRRVVLIPHRHEPELRP